MYSKRETSFREDFWAGNESLKPSFPRLYQISSQRNAKVKDILEGGVSEARNLQFRRRLFLLWSVSNQSRIFCVAGSSEQDCHKINA